MPLDVISFALKFGGAVCVLAGCWGMGYGVCAGMNKRLAALREFYRLTLHMKGEIRCMSEPVPAMLEHTAQMSDPVFRDFLLDVSHTLYEGHGRSLASIWSEMADCHLRGGPLTGQDIDLIRRLGEMLGSRDTKMQLSVLELFLEELQTVTDKLYREMDSQKKVYGGLWVLGGIFIVILFI